MYLFTQQGINSLYGRQEPTYHRQMHGLMNRIFVPEFKSSWKTDNTGVSNDDQVKLPLMATGSYSFDVDWGDGNTDTITTWDQAETTHTYSAPGTYEITITGQIEGFQFADVGDKEKILDVSEWGPMVFISVNNRAFWGCVNMDVTATDVPINNSTSFEFFFRNMSVLVNANGSIGRWNITGVTDLFSCFRDDDLFNGDVGNWDVSAVIKFDSCFFHADAFSGKNLDKWTPTATSSTMAQLFSTLPLFNTDISGWDVSGVTDMTRMLEACTGFNQDIGVWDVGNVTTVLNMLNGSTAFDQDLGSWDITSLTDATAFLLGVTLSVANYESLLVGWEANTHNSTVTFHGGNSQYNDPSAAATARAALVTDSWTITDGGAV